MQHNEELPLLIATKENPHAAMKTQCSKKKKTISQGVKTAGLSDLKTSAGNELLVAGGIQEETAEVWAGVSARRVQC